MSFPNTHCSEVCILREMNEKSFLCKKNIIYFHIGYGLKKYCKFTDFTSQ